MIDIDQGKGPPEAVLSLFLLPGLPGGTGAALLPVLWPQTDTVAHGQRVKLGRTIDVMAAEMDTAAADRVVMLGIYGHIDHLNNNNIREANICQYLSHEYCMVTT